jgi:polyhydroxybutyrate depolymerase
VEPNGRRQPGRLRLILAVTVAVAVCGALAATGLTYLERSGAPSGRASGRTPAPTRWTTTNDQLEVDGRTRRYLLVRPQAVSTTPLPVVVVLHGRTVTPEIEEQRTGFTSVVGRAILVYPAGYQESWNAGACCAGARSAGVDDVAFIKNVVHQVLASQRDAAAGQVFLVGFSNGGKMAFRLACADPDLFAGVAVVGAVPVSACPRPPAIPFIALAFDNDPLVTLTAAQPHKQVNGYVEASIEEQVDAQRGVNACSPAGGAQVRGSLTVTTWTACASRKPVQFALYQGNTHMWPAGDATTPSAERVIWEFFGSTMEDRR